MATVGAGVIVFRALPRTREFLLLRAVQGHWSPPKGHRDPDPAGQLEPERQTALRELCEESGIKDTDIILSESFRAVSLYQLPKPTRRVPSGLKRVAFFIGQVRDPEVTLTLQETEVQDSAWLELDRAIETLNFPEISTIMQQANAFLDSPECDI
eukprot:m.17218 g.17218  ORF g.17218 m.17218 type:complete len:155 (-) comp5416_c0_seq2:108-572(-)